MIYPSSVAASVVSTVKFVAVSATTKVVLFTVTSVPDAAIAVTPLLTYTLAITLSPPTYAFVPSVMWLFVLATITVGVNPSKSCATSITTSFDEPVAVISVTVNPETVAISESVTPVSICATSSLNTNVIVLVPAPIALTFTSCNTGAAASVLDVMFTTALFPAKSVTDWS